VDGEVPFEDEIPAILGLIDGVGAAQVDGLAVLLGKLGAQQPAQ